MIFIVAINTCPSAPAHKFFVFNAYIKVVTHALVEPGGDQIVILAVGGIPGGGAEIILILLSFEYFACHSIYAVSDIAHGFLIHAHKVIDGDSALCKAQNELFKAVCG